VAEAQLAIAERDYALWLEGPHPDDLAAAEARLNAAQAAQAAAQSALDNSVLTAPFDGVAVAVSLKEGEMVGGGQIAAVVADVSHWVVETDNLTEIEVVEVYEGQAVIVTPDALPALELSGTVDAIDGLFEEKRGDVTYTATISLEDAPPDLRWGMTVVITFQE
jgi:multidrug resistance efflux pump